MPLYCAWYAEILFFSTCIHNASYLENLKFPIFIQRKISSTTTLWSYFERHHAPCLHSVVWLWGKLRSDMLRSCCGFVCAYSSDMFFCASLFSGAFLFLHHRSIFCVCVCATLDQKNFSNFTFLEKHGRNDVYHCVLKGSEWTRIRTTLAHVSCLVIKYPNCSDICQLGIYLSMNNVLF